MAIKGNKGEQMRRVVHLSISSDPPHTVKHPDPKSYGDDRRFNNEVIFAGGVEHLKPLAESDVLDRRPYVHTYEVPESLISPETFADDTFPGQSKWFHTHPKGELGSDLPASRQDAVTNKRVVKYTNAIEAAGKLSYIMPKSRIESGDIRYVGLTEHPYPWKWES